MSSAPSTLILEGVVTTVDAGRRINVAPMGPIVDPAMTTLRLRPFNTSTTFRNLKRMGVGVLHVVDDALLIAKAAIGRLDEPPAMFPAERIDGFVLRTACRWHEFEVVSLDDSHDRTEIVARVVHSGRLRDFFGFNRAKHAVLEAAILATRLHLRPKDEVLRELAALRIPVTKTGGEDERVAFEILEKYVAEWPASESVEQQPRVARPDALGRAWPGAQTTPFEDSGRATQPRVTVRTGSRLHFGPLAVGAPAGRQFGGVGMMLDKPGFVLSAQSRADADEDDLSGCPIEFQAAIRRALDRFRATEPDPTPIGPVAIRMEESIPPHAGLGSGTQLALAVAKAMSVMFGPACATARDLAPRVSRGLRSVIGMNGFDVGGLLVDGGKASPEAIGTVVARVDVPEWGVALITPPEPGLSGVEERQAFARLPAMSADVTDRLCRIALLDLLPAVQEGDFAKASAAVHAYGRIVGEYFAPVQGGVYASRRMRGLADHLRANGIEGVGQTSWGPTLFAFLPDRKAAEALCRELQVDARWSDCRFHAAWPRNEGADVNPGLR